MKKSIEQLIKLAHRLQGKYAIYLNKHIEEAVKNAASWGPRVHGIMNFPEQLKLDQATMTITVSKDGRTVNVSEPVFNPPNVSSNYPGLSIQIKKYLEKHLDLFTNYEDASNLVLNYSGVDATYGVTST